MGQTDCATRCAGCSEKLKLAGNAADSCYTGQQAPARPLPDKSSPHAVGKAGGPGGRGRLAKMVEEELCLLPRTHWIRPASFPLSPPASPPRDPPCAPQLS